LDSTLQCSSYLSLLLGQLRTPLCYLPTRPAPGQDKFFRLS